MELLLSVHYDPANLVGKPHEFDPFVAVWTTDPEQSQTVVPGKAVDVLDLDEKGFSKKSVSFSNASGSFPIRDIMADVCIALYSKTESDGARPDAGKLRPYTLDIGQINVPWHFILRWMMEEGTKVLGKMDKAEMETRARSRVFPSVKIKQEVRSQVTYEGVEYEIQAQMGADQNLAMELKRVGADALSRRGHLTIIASLVMTSEKTLQLPLERRIDHIEYFYLTQCPIFKDKKVVLGESHPSSIVKASQEYDRMTKANDDTYNRAMERYRNVYDALWTATSHRQLIIKSRDGSKSTLFSPDVPSMVRFHLPTWNICNDRIPYAEWILQTVPENATHLAQPGLGTEYYLRTLADMAFKRVDISQDDFTSTVENLTIRADKMNIEDLKKYLQTGSEARNLLIKSTELVFYTVMMIAHATRYGGDGRIIKLFKRMVRLEVEAPQHDMISGTSDDGDCEDEETPEIIVASLIQLGRRGGDHETGGRGWGDPVLECMRRILHIYADFTIFGSVSGRQISDAEAKKGIEDEEGFIRTPDDINEPIGGHTFMIEQALLELADRYETSSELVDLVLGYSVSRRIRNYVEGLIKGWITNVSASLLKILMEIYKSFPTAILEGTGRQEPLQLPLETYFGLSHEFLRRLAERASEIDLLERWPRMTPEEEKKENEKKKKHHHNYDSGSESESEKPESKRALISSMGEAAPYMFQKRLTIHSMCKRTPEGTTLQRHISSFYRRPCHTVSCKLHKIMPDDFVHCIFVDPVRRTYGPPLRYVLETGGNAIPIPLSFELHQTYMKHMERQADGSVIHVSDLLAQRMRRVIPYDLSFQHLHVSETADKGKQKEDETVVIVSNAPVASTLDHVALLAKSASASFFCRSDFQHDAKALGGAIKTPAQSANSSKPLVITVGSDSPVADAIRSLTLHKQASSFLVENVTSRMVTRPPAGVIKPDNIRMLSQHVLSGAGVTKLNIYSERVLPWLADNLCAHFERNVQFVISDSKVASRQGLVRSSAQQLRLLSQTRLDLLLEEKQTTLREIMDELQVDPDVITEERLKAGVVVELEHGTKLVHWQTNVTRDSLKKTAQIALAHLVENPGLRNLETGEYIIPDYYHMLERMEREADKAWANYKKPPIFLHKHYRPMPTITSLQALEYSMQPADSFSSSPSARRPPIF